MAKVSIFMLVYNQEQYIAQTIESILMQKTSFDYQLVIGEDCSTDTTGQICEAYQKKHPSKIKLLPSLNKNIGLIANYMRTIKACDGKYIAICDGDDYWIDDKKLQKQVDFLEANPNFSIVYTKVLKLFPDGSLKKSIMNQPKQGADFDDLILENFIPSVTAIFRNNQNKSDVPQWIENFPYGDWPTYLWTLKDGGKIHFLDTVTAVYRTDIGISSKIRKKRIETAKINLEIVKCIASDSSFAHKKSIVQKSLLEHKKNLMACYNREKLYLKAIKLFLKTLFSTKGKINLTKFFLYSIKQSF